MTLEARTFKTICCKCNTARIALITELLAVFNFNNLELIFGPAVIGCAFADT